MTFEGFTPDTLEFMADLTAHNDREWFAENRDRYERVLLGPERALVGALGEAFATVDPRVRCEPAVNGSIFRINRDTRFSRDKSPYKTHADMWFWLGEDRKQSPGYFVRLVPDAVWVGGGRHFMTPEVLGSLRAAIAAETTGGELADIVASLEADGYVLGESASCAPDRSSSGCQPTCDVYRALRRGDWTPLRRMAWWGRRPECCLRTLVSTATVPARVRAVARRPRRPRTAPA